MQDNNLESIEQVIAVLESIIQESIKTNDPMGYFAALYQKVTIKVKEGISNGFFEDGPRMEQLDIIFAKRYIDAYFAYREGEGVTASWTKCFELTKNYAPVVLQHLLMGMNAHINLDLGIAAAEISGKDNIDGLRTDFYRINEVLAALINDVQSNLEAIWPTLSKILKRVGGIDNFLADFSMGMARDGAWSFAQKLAQSEPGSWEALIEARDRIVAEKSALITNHSVLLKLLFYLVRLGEKGTVADKIRQLKFKADQI